MTQISLYSGHGMNGLKGASMKKKKILQKLAGAMLGMTVGLSVFTAGIYAQEQTDAVVSMEILKQQELPLVMLEIDETQGTIEAMNADPEHNTECTGTITISVPEDYISPYSKEKQPDQTLELKYIRGRGNSTWRQDKKPYKIKLRDGADLFGMGKGKHWVLIANYFDATLVRNEYTYRLASELGMEFAPKLVPINLMMNGEYLGVYTLGTQVRVAKNSVNIDDLTDEEEIEDVSGGYLLNFGEKVEGDALIVTSHENRLGMVSPDPEEVENPELRAYIANYIEEFEAALYGEDFKDETGVRYDEYLDLDSAVDYFLLQHVPDNDDGIAGASNYLYKKRGGKLFMGPVWDYDFCPWGNGDAPYEGFKAPIEWYCRMLEDDVFCERLLQRWEEVRQVMTDSIAEGGLLDQLTQTIGASYELNYQVNPIIKMIDNPDFDIEAVFEGVEDPRLTEVSIPAQNITSQGEIETMRSWIRNRIDWVDAHIGNIRELSMEAAVQRDAMFDELELDFAAGELDTETAFELD